MHSPAAAAGSPLPQAGRHLKEGPHRVHPRLKRRVHRQRAAHPAGGRQAGDCLQAACTARCSSSQPTPSTKRTQTRPNPPAAQHLLAARLLKAVVYHEDGTPVQAVPDAAPQRLHTGSGGAGRGPGGKGRRSGATSRVPRPYGSAQPTRPSRRPPAAAHPTWLRARNACCEYQVSPLTRPSACWPRSLNAFFSVTWRVQGDRGAGMGRRQAAAPLPALRQRPVCPPRRTCNQPRSLLPSTLNYHPHSPSDPWRAGRGCPQSPPHARCHRQSPNPLTPAAVG